MSLFEIYRSEVLIEPNLVLSLVPTPLTEEMTATKMPAASRPHLIAVAAVSSSVH
jgi:hypothetical protein